MILQGGEYKVTKKKKPNNAPAKIAQKAKTGPVKTTWSFGPRQRPPGKDFPGR